MFRLFATTALLLAAVTTARAETICNNCEPFTYLGGHWIGDRSTFIFGPGAFGDYVFDLNENATVEVTVTGPAGLRISLYEATVADCTEIGAQCGQFGFWVKRSDQHRKLRTRRVAGRYVISIENPAGGNGSTYSGTVTVERQRPTAVN
jgi:hypothetical protein